MDGITYEYIDTYLRSLIEDNDELACMVKYAKENHVPIIQSEGARFLELMTSILKPKKILEIGTAIGYSSILMCRASSNCLIDTIERNEDMISIAKENIKKYKLEDKIKILEGEAQEVLESLDDKYDLIFIDAGKGHYNHFLPEVLRLLDKNGTIIADNVLFRGMVASKEVETRRKVTIVKRMKKYLEMVNTNEFITSILPLGDGIAVTKRRSDLIE